MLAFDTPFNPNPLQSVCVEYKWTPRFSEENSTLQKFVKFPGMSTHACLLKAGVNENKHLDHLSCTVFSDKLGQLGCHVGAVVCTMERTRGCSGDTFLHAMFLENDNVNVPTNDMLFLLFEHKPGDFVRIKNESTLIFHFYVIGVVKEYSAFSFDCLLGQQLWNAAVNQHNTDVVFQVGDSTFTAHKFVVAARCPVFRGMFNANMVESQTGRVNIIDDDPEVFEQFLRFLYTGQLSGSTSKQLEAVADKYQVETLVLLCRAMPPSNDGWAAQMRDWKCFLRAHEHRAMETNFEVAGLNFLGNPANAEAEDAEDQSHVTTTYFVRDPAASIDVLNLSHRRIVDNVFLCHYSLISTSQNGLVDIAFSSSIGERWQWTISSVDLMICNGEETLFRTTMKPCSNSWTDFIQSFYFYVQRELLNGTGICVLHFIVHRVPVVKSLKGQLRDSRFAQELSSAAINKEWTDVEFHVGGSIFFAHRALLVARCPDLAALVPAESSPASPAIVPITGIHPTHFKRLLYFLYTGLIKTYFRHCRSLLEAAKTFNIDALTQSAL